MRPWRRALMALGLATMAAVTAAPPAALGQSRSSYVINLRETQIQAFAEQVSDITGRTLILDPAVRGDVTVISSEPLSPDAVWQLFQSVLRVYGYAALKSGDAWRIVPQEGVGSGAALIGEGRAGSEDFVTRLVRLRRLPSEEAARVLEPLVASFGRLEALSRPNAIVVTDTAANASRVAELAQRLDDQPGQQTASFRLRYAGAREMARAVSDLLGQDGALAGVAADERSNTLLVRGETDQIEQVRDLVASLDRPSGVAPQVQVFRLRNGDAEVVAKVLRGVLGLGSTATNPAARSLAGLDGGGGVRGGGPVGMAERVAQLAGGGGDDGGVAFSEGGGGGDVGGDLAIEPAAELNAIVARGSPAAIAEIGRLITQLDVRRPQVLIEAAIVEISGDAAEQLGVQFGVGAAAANTSGGFAANSATLTGPSLRGLLGALGVPVAAAIGGQGLSIGFGVGDDFAVLIQALAQSSRANLLSTPSLTTLDNQPAEIVVGQNVPFLTGTFTPSGQSNDPFSTIEREDVGITLRVVPRVHEGDVVRLEVMQEASSLTGPVAGAADLVTNRRSITTTVLADNGGTIVLGGLITDNRLSQDSKVPVLGDIPVLGRLFRSDSESVSKQTLFVFLRPTILRNRADVKRAADLKYDRLRQVQNQPLTDGSLLVNRAVRTLPLELNGLY